MPWRKGRRRSIPRLRRVIGDAKFSYDGKGVFNKDEYVTKKDHWERTKTHI